MKTAFYTRGAETTQGLLRKTLLGHKVSATLLRIADVRRFTKEVQKDLPGSNPNIQRPDLPDDSAIVSATQGAVEVQEIRKSVAVNKR